MEPREPTDPPKTLEAVRADLGDCRRCGLCENRRELVFGVGNPAADLLIVGEGPGAEEDRRGEPFVGKAGAMLDRMLANVLGLDRSQVYILNIVKCRPPQNRDPEPREIEACMPFLEAQFRAIRPRVVMTLGRVAARTLLQERQGIRAIRGSWREYQGTPLMPTFHPAYLLRQPEERRKTWQDLLAVKDALASLD
ncbi:MAG: uracil-DNA glycosylase [Myxococcota bacterium]|nr:uracil-DNA glycosylase [Myxococcota bacterium]